MSRSCGLCLESAATAVASVLFFCVLLHLYIFSATVLCTFFCNADMLKWLRCFACFFLRLLAFCFTLFFIGLQLPYSTPFLVASSLPEGRLC